MSLVLVAALLAGVAPAQLPIAETKCIEHYNKALVKVAKQAGKDARRCVRDALRGTQPDPDGCVAATGSTLAKREQGVAKLFDPGRRCAPPASVIVQTPAIGIAAVRDALGGLLDDAFASPYGLSSSPTVAACVDRSVNAAQQALVAILRGQSDCKRAALRLGTATDEASLTTACGSMAQFDANGRVSARLATLDAGIQTHCAFSPSTLAMLFDGLDAACHADRDALADCLQARVRCRACEAINGADGTAIDCDLFDDAAANFSCAGPLAIGSHACTFGAGSELDMISQGLPLSLTPSGSLSIDCGTTGPAGDAACTCDFTSFAPLVVPAIGDVCLTPVAGCPAGTIDCDGGTPLDVVLRADHDVGACTGNADCAATCDAHCAGLGAGFARSAHGCEGFCQGGANDAAPCTLDSQCPGGQCVGPDPLAPLHAGTCNCACTAVGQGPPAAPGQLACQAGYQLHVELPSNGACGDPVAYTLAPQCMALTTTAADGRLTDTNRTAGKNMPPSGPSLTAGNGLACATIAASSTAGLELVGHQVWFDSTLGDWLSTNAFVCQ